jgi:GT2 family glycosyltransferase
VLVVDNGSTDDSVLLLRATYPGLTLLEAGENLGYSGGNNLGMVYALGRACDYVWLLNDDVVVAPDSLSILMDTACSNPQAGFLGPMVRVKEHPERILSAGRKLDRRWHSQHRGIGGLDQGQYEEVMEVDSVSGCAMLVSQSVIEAVGLLDEDFFCYYEEVEWCHRGRRAGFEVQFVPEAKVWHPDTHARDIDSTLVAYYMSRNRLLFLKKHRLGSRLIVGTLTRYLLQVANWSVRPKWRHKRAQRDAVVRAIIDFALGRFGRAVWLG